MIYKRFAANLRAQNWFAIGIELGIVILGVFVGTMVANWNQVRIEERQTRQLLEQIRPDLARMASNFGYSIDYYATTRRYAEVALAGWRGERAVSDSDFVIAAYQASQIYALTLDSATWANVMGADRIQSLGDPSLRRQLSEVLFADYAPVRAANLYTDYRKNVRRVIPIAIQDRIRERCGDRTDQRGDSAFLPPTCDLTLPAAEASAVAAKLRANPELADDLGYHFAVIAVALITSHGAKAQIEALLPPLDRFVSGAE